jgi:hypothetical protein
MLLKAVVMPAYAKLGVQVYGIAQMGAAKCKSLIELHAGCRLQVVSARVTH